MAKTRRIVADMNFFMCLSVLICKQCLSRVLPRIPSGLAPGMKGCEFTPFPQGNTRGKVRGLFYLNTFVDMLAI